MITMGSLPADRSKVGSTQRALRYLADMQSTLPEASTVNGRIQPPRPDPPARASEGAGSWGWSITILLVLATLLILMFLDLSG